MDVLERLTMAAQRVVNLSELFRLSEVDLATGCWNWSGTRMERGYGWIGARLAHRASYEFFVGPIPKGLVIDHLCNTPSCINPQHLRACTQSENVIRAKRKPACPNGHRYDEKNTYFTPTGRIRCRDCRRIGEANRRAER